jgi:ATP-binding cassette subfamily F protein 3
MASFVQFSQITLHFGDRPILVNVSLNLKSGTKAALCGDNGTGKTTLLRVLAGVLEADTGDRALQKGARLSYLPQSITFEHSVSSVDKKGEALRPSVLSLRAYVDHAFDWGYALVAEQEAIAEKLATDGGAVRANNYSPLQRYQEITDALENADWNRREERCAIVLQGLGFSRAEFGNNITAFSPGWQMRAALAKVLLEAPDFLLLDEPTNYLDLEARTWLEGFLADFRGGFLLVSHDRYFLDATVTEVYELFSGTLRRYKGNYTAYEKTRAVELETLVAAYKAQQEEIQKLEDFIRRFGYKATKAAAAQERQKMLDKMVRIEIPETLKKIHFRFPDPPHSGRLAITLDGIGKTYDAGMDDHDCTGDNGRTGVHDCTGVACNAPTGMGKTVLCGLSLVVERGDRLVVTGPNGAGKSTLLRIIAGADKTHDGTVTYGAGVTVAYYSQDNPETLDAGKNLVELVEAAAPTALIPKARDLLGAFLFRGDDVYKTVAVLSGGERARAALLLMLLRPANVLVLDEPTNHLDLHSKDVLLDAIKNYPGTVLFVSHDRAFIESLATRVLDLTPPSEGTNNPSTARDYPGGYAYYLEQKAKTAATASASSASGGSPPRAPKPPASSLPPLRGETPRVPVGTPEFAPQTRASSPPRNAPKNSPDPQKSGAILVKNEKRRREREEYRLLAEITVAEEKKAAIEAALSKPENYTDGEKSRTLQAALETAAANLARLTAAWEGIAAP